MRSGQVIYDNRDDSALKLTIAQYLTPGGISIQSVGIVPDIRVRGLFIDPDDEGIDIFEGPRRGEDSLEKHLDSSSGGKKSSEKPNFTLDYLREIELEKQIEKRPNQIHVDFEVRLAKELLQSVATPYREICSKLRSLY